MKYSIPVVCNEALWSVGTSMLTVIMGHMSNSQDMLAAYALIGNIDKISTVVCFGIAASAAVMVGKEIGQGHDREQIYSVGWTLLLVSMLVGAVVTVLELALLPTPHTVPPVQADPRRGPGGHLSVYRLRGIYAHARL